MEQSQDRPHEVKIFYATFGGGQPNFPGYVEVSAKDYWAATDKMHEAYGAKWGFLYNTLEEVHPLDRVFRGRI